MVLIRSLLYNLFATVTVLAAAALLVLLFWAPYRLRWAICVGWCRLAMWGLGVICGLRIEVEGRENLPDEPSVIMIKHSSTMETLWQVTAFPRTTWVLKREIRWFPLIGWAIAALEPIAIDRAGGGSAVKQVIKQGTEKLRSGTWVTIFPEGTRVPPGKTRRYGISGAALAREARAPIVPVAHNAGDLWTRGSLAKKRPGTVRFCIGPAIDATTQSPKETNEIAQNWVEAKMREISEAYR
jgi:1-acyl-sn-glycerol-3-phosphate acyltransferase